MKLKFCLSILALLLQFMECESAAGQPPVWSRYINVKYDYAGCYPPDVFKGSGESPAGDGQVFNAQDGASVSMFGSLLLSTNLSGQMLDDEATDFGNNGKITLHVLKENYFILSGFHGSNIIYQKTLFTNGVTKTLLISYSAEKQKIYDPIVTRMAACFVALPPLGWQKGDF